MTISYIKKVSAAALGSVNAVLNQWVPGGKYQGHEYLPLNPKRVDSTIGSFSINVNTGAWSDFATGDKGLDLVSLIACLESIPQGDAAKRLGAFLKIDPDEINPPKRARIDSKASGNGKVPTNQNNSRNAEIPSESENEWHCIMPITDNAPKPPLVHPIHGKPSNRYPYCNENGQINFYHDRYEKTKGKKKQFAPITLWRKDGQCEWRFKAPPTPRPLYGLPGLVAFPKVDCWFVEGEKAVGALQKLLPNHPILCWQGGSQAVEKSNYTPLAGRNCVVFRDNDEAGKKAAHNLVKQLMTAGALSVRVLNVEKLALTPAWQDKGEQRSATLNEGKPLAEGDDAADLIERGWEASHFALLLERKDIFISPNLEATKPASKHDEQQSETLQRGFELLDDGLYFIEPTKDGKLRRRRISARLEVLARTRTADNKDWGLLTKFQDHDGHIKKIILPMRHFNGDALQVTSVLLSEGLDIASQGRRNLIEYLQTAEIKKRARTSDRSGWHGEADELVYLFHDEYIGTSSEEWLCSNQPEEPIFKQRGTLQQWQQNISSLCAGNSRLVFAISAAFGSALIHLVNGESGGIHFRGSSSSGKTTALRVASSVMGAPDYMLQWRGTDNSMEGSAQMRTDALLVLDELKQIDPKIANEVCYMLGNGSGKNRNKAEGGNRKLIKWRTIMLSAGEISLEQHVAEAGKRVYAGAAIRLCDIDADAGVGMGAFENIHGYELPSKFAETLAANVAKYYGVPFVEFIKQLIVKRDEVIPTLKECEEAFSKETLTEQASGQARRVASRFALIVAGGEIATEWGITGWKPGEAMQAGIACFKAWLAGYGGESNQEERLMIQKVKLFLEKHHEGRFISMDRIADKDHAPKTMDRVGYRESKNIGKDIAELAETHYFIFPEAFKTEVCKGEDYRAVAKLLINKGYMKPGDGKNLAVKKSLPYEGKTRVYHILPSIWSDDD